MRAALYQLLAEPVDEDSALEHTLAFPFLSPFLLSVLIHSSHYLYTSHPLRYILPFLVSGNGEHSVLGKALP